MTSLLVQMELDAAKRLRAENAELKRKLEAALAEPDVLDGWVSVANRLPNEIVLASYVDFDGRQIVVRACYFKKHEQETNNEDNFDYDEASDTYYIPEGWYECISNWDDYSSVAIHHAVTHWMPLPATPKTKKEESC